MLIDGPPRLTDAPAARGLRDEAGWIHEVIARAGLEAALNVVTLREPHTLRIVVDGRPAPLVDLDGELAEPCGRAVATALLEHQGDEPTTWSVSVLAWDAEGDAEVLVAEWHGGP